MAYNKSGQKCNFGVTNKLACQGISLGHEIVHIHHLEKHLTEQVIYTFLGKKEHQLFSCN